jgi:hypothetical protein
LTDGGFLFGNPANAGGAPNLDQMLKKKKKHKGDGPASFLNPLAQLADVMGALNPSNTAGSLSEAIEKQAANQKAQAALKGGGGVTDPFQALQEQLYNAANGINVAPTPLEELRKMATSQVAAQYDPQLAALNSEIKGHGDRAVRSEKTARDMYGALSKDYLSQMPDITAQYKAEDDATNQRYDQAQQQMNGEYQDNAKQQDDVLKQLGITAAAPDASQQTKEDQAYFQNQTEADQQNALSALSQQQSAQTDYQRNLGSNAKMAGENTAEGIHQDLTDYLNQANSQKTQLQGQRGAAIEALLAQMQQQDASRVQSQSQDQFNNMMKLFNFQLSAQKADSSSHKGGGGFGGGSGLDSITSGLQGANNYLANVYPDQPILAKNLMAQLNDVLSNKAVTQGKFQLDPGNPSLGQAPKYSDTGQEYMMDLLRHQFEKQGGRYNNQDLNATMNALLAYMGKLH